MGSLITKIKKTRSRKSKKSYKHNDEPDLDTVTDMLEQQEEKIQNEIEDTEQKLKEESDVRRRQSLQRTLQNRKRSLKAIESRKEELEKLSLRQTMKLVRLGKRVSQDTSEETERAMHFNSLVQRRFEESTM